MLDLVLRPLADAFMQVGVFVAFLVAPFGWARHRWGDRMDAALSRHRRLAPLVAALLTVPPGCGGAIIVMAVYARGAVSYGAAISALVATMGDACWVLLAADPVLTLELKVLLVTTGTVTGVVVDALGISPALTLPGSRSAPAEEPRAPLPVVQPATTYDAVVVPAPRLDDLGLFPRVLWAVLAVGLAVSLPVTFHLVDPAGLGRVLLGHVDPYVAVGVIGSLLCLVGFLGRGAAMADDDEATARPASLAQVLHHGGYEVSFVTVWVAVAYLSWSLVTHLTGFDGSQLPVLGFAGVLVGALIGLVPGCAVQIIFAGIFVAGGMPLPTLLANTISQDGDALIPLLALQHRPALLATVVTTVPALLVGSALLLLS